MPAFTFLGKTCIGGVSTGMATALTAAEAALNAAFAAAALPDTFEEFVGVREPHKGMHPGGQHTTGDAVDINFESCPYIAVRTPKGLGAAYGGENPGTAVAANAIRMARIRATVVYDRAVAFFADQSTVANVSCRADGEATGDAYDRFRAASDAVAAYLQLAFPPTLPAALSPPPRVVRIAVAGAADADLATLLTAIPVPERLDITTARANVSAVVADPAFATAHPDWPTDEDFWLTQILRDYEAVRVPMEFGTPSLRPAQTRNPANGFVDLPRDVVVSVAGDPPGTLLRWGVCDFGTSESGDVQHFDRAARISAGIPGTSPPEVRIDPSSLAGVQQALASLGFDPNGVDGIPGPGTDIAVGAFRSAVGLGPGGIDTDFTDAIVSALHQAAVPF